MGSIMESQLSVLLVREAEDGDEFRSLGSSIVYSFTEQTSPTGFQAWQETTDQLWVHCSCRELLSDFSVQALNYPVAQKIVQSDSSDLVVWGAYGATMDLARVADFLAVRSWFVFDDDDVERLLFLSGDALAWVAACLAVAQGVFVANLGTYEVALHTRYPCLNGKLYSCSALESLVAAQGAVVKTGFDYSVYEMVLRDHPLLCAMQAPDVRHFQGCQNVADLGAGVGIFIHLLRQQNIAGTGIERNSKLVGYGRAMGLALTEYDALEYLQDHQACHDGVYCSHFVEHLPIELVEKLISGISRLLQPGGVAVLTFPDPESIRSQLLGFWRDPEHVRFYHPELVINIARSVGLRLEWSSYQDAPHEVVSFSEEPPPVAQLGVTEIRPSLWQRILARLGIASYGEVKQLQDRLKQQQLINRQLVDRTNQLWSVNKTWAWNDNVTLRFRKP